MTDPRSPGVFVRRDFLPPFELARVLGALDRLSGRWTASEGLGLLGRANTRQIRPTDILAHSQLDEIRLILAAPVVRWARSCGFRLPPAPHVQMFPVWMSGDAESPASQEPHTDTRGDPPLEPLCTNVFYARVTRVVGGALAVRRGETLDDPIVVAPAVNTIATIGGDRVHWVQPLYAGERLSVVVNLY
jgi:hypothetical protein